MQEVSSDFTKIVENTMYEKELIVSKRIFKEVKKDLVCKVATLKR